MNFSKKRLLKLSGLLCGIGLIIGIIGFGMLGFDYRNLSKTEVYPIEEKLVTDKINELSKIKVETKNKDILVKRTENNEIKISGAGLESSVLEGVLSVSYKDRPQENVKWYRIFNFDLSSSHTIVIEIPKAFTGELDVLNGYGKVQIENLFPINRLTCHVEQGNVNLNKLEINNAMTINMTYGNMTLDGVKAGKESSIDLKQVECNLKNLAIEELVIKNVYGDIRTENFQGNRLKINSEQSKIILENIQAKEKLEASVEYGDIDFTKISSPLISLETEQGDIRGTVYGKMEDYKISVRSEQGQSNLETKLNGINELYVEALSDVEIYFTE